MPDFDTIARSAGKLLSKEYKHTTPSIVSYKQLELRIISIINFLIFENC